MGSGIFIAMSGAVAQNKALDVTASNVANAGTPGYKAERVSFSEALSKSKDASFAAAGRTQSDPSEGPLTHSGNPLDFAIAGDGYFAVETPQGERYTRAGNFRLDPKGVLVNAEGYPVLALDPEAKKAKHIKIPPTAARVTASVDGTLAADDQVIGRLKIAHFAKDGLEREGANLYRAVGPAVPGKAPEVMQGTIEGANFNIIRGVVDMVKTTRTYEALHRMLESYREMDERAARSSGR